MKFLSLVSALVVLLACAAAHAGDISGGLSFPILPGMEEINDLHVTFKEPAHLAGPEDVSHIPTPPAPKGNLNWPSVHVTGNGRTVHFSGTSVPSEGVCQYQFTLHGVPDEPPPGPLSNWVERAAWTRDGSEVDPILNLETITDIPFEP